MVNTNLSILGCQKMKIIVIMLFFIMGNSHGSDTPLSGSFSNATSNHLGYMGSTMSSKMNLIVTLNGTGQQFFIQCFNEDTLGFGVITQFKVPHINVTINAGQYCPSNLLQVELGYNGATIRSDSKWAHLMRGGIYIPVPIPE